MLVTIPFAVRPAPRIGGGKSVRRYLPQWYQDQREYLTVVFMAAQPWPEWPLYVGVLVGQKGVGRGDGDNVEKPICDAMVRAGMIPDDSFKYIRDRRTACAIHQACEYTRVRIVEFDTLDVSEWYTEVAVGPEEQAV